MKYNSSLGPWLNTALLTAALGFSACDDDGTAAGSDAGVGADASAACPAGGMGTLALTIVAPVALTPSIVAIGGPSALYPTQGLPVAVVAGPYTIKADRVKVAPTAPAVIGKTYYPASIAFAGCVMAGQTATVTVTYALEPGSNKAWVTPANGVGAVAAFDETQLRATGDQAAVVTRTMGITQAADLAFDLMGNLWVSDTGVGGGLLGYRMETLGTAADRNPDVKITGWSNARALAFDAAGNLWGAENVPGGTDRIVMLPASALGLGTISTGATTTRAAAPTVIVTSGELADPFDIAFDAMGNLWSVSNTKDQIVKFSAAQLGAGGNLTPVVILKAARVTGPVQGAYNGPTSLTFDAAGNLWAAWNAGGTLARFTVAQLAATATIMDPQLLDPMGSGGAGVGAERGAFDASGGLWLSRASIGMPAAMVRVPAAGVAAGGEQATDPNMSGTGLGNGAGNIVFNPVPTGLPIRD